MPEYSGVRLWPDSVAALLDGEPVSSDGTCYTEKRRFLGGDPAVGAVPLRRLYVLGPSGSDIPDITLERLTPTEAIMELIQCSHMLDVTDKEMIRVKFEQLTALSEQIPGFPLAFPHEYSRLGEVCSAVIA